MNNIGAVFTGSMIITAVALLAMAVTIGFWAVRSLIDARRTQRPAQHLTSKHHDDARGADREATHALAA